MKAICKIIIISAVFNSFAYAQDILSIQRLSQNAQGVGVDADVGAPFLSPNSDRLVFASKASNLVDAGNITNNFHIYLQDVVTGTVTRISDGELGFPGNGNSSAPVMTPASANGFFAIVFESNATNLAKRKQLFPDNNNAKDIFISIPRRNFFLERVSVGPAALEANDSSSQASATFLHADRTAIVAYTSRATNLVTSDTNGKSDIFLAAVNIPKDDVFDPTVDIVTSRISLGFGGVESDGDSSNPVVSQDGRFIAFESVASNLVEGGVSGGIRQVYLYDRTNGTTQLLSKGSSAAGNALSGSISMNYNGKFIVYASAATNIVEDGFVPQASYLQIFLFNRETGVTVRVNSSEAGVPGNGQDGQLVQAAVSADGRFVLFSDSASNLVDNDTNEKSDIFIKDLATAKVVKISQSLSAEQATGHSFFPTFNRSKFNSDTGRCSFASGAPNLVANDTEGNPDIFLSTISIPPLPFTAQTRIETPPDITLSSDNKQVTIGLQEFSGISLSNNKSRALLEATKPKEKLGYLIKLAEQDVPKKKQDLRNIYTKRNELNVKNLKSGNYSMKYQAQVVRVTDDKIISKSPFSPTVFFNTLDE